MAAGWRGPRLEAGQQLEDRVGEAAAGGLGISHSHADKWGGTNEE